MRLRSVIAILLALVAPRLAAQSADSLLTITRRGRELAAYDAALSGAIDAMRRLGIADSCAARYVERRVGSRFVVRFGHWDAARDTFYISYEATERNGPDDFGLNVIRPERAAEPDERADVVAIDRTARDVGRPPRPMRAIAIPAASGARWVYWLPAPQHVGIWPLGDDWRYLVSVDGSRILSKRRLHRTFAETVLPLDARYGTHDANDDVPEDSDIMLVLERRPAVPEIISARGRIYYISVDGTISLGR